MKIKKYIWLALLPLALFIAACQPPANSTQTATSAARACYELFRVMRYISVNEPRKISE